MSTGLNSMAGVIYEDMIKPCLRAPVSESTASRTIKATVVFTGIVCVALVFLAEKLSGLIQVIELLHFFLTTKSLNIFLLVVGEIDMLHEQSHLPIPFFLAGW